MVWPNVGIKKEMIVEPIYKENDENAYIAAQSLVSFATLIYPYVDD